MSESKLVKASSELAAAITLKNATNGGIRGKLDQFPIHRTFTAGRVLLCFGVEWIWEVYLYSHINDMLDVENIVHLLINALQVIVLNN